jgi:hypothetical protein
MRQAFWMLLLILTVAYVSPAAADMDLRVDIRRQWLRGMSSDARFTLVDENAQPVAGQRGRLQVDGEWFDASGSLQAREIEFGPDGEFKLEGIEVRSGSGSFELVLEDGTRLTGTTRVVHPAWPLVPALLSIAIALTLRQVLLALTLGVFAGAWIIAGNPLIAFSIALEKIVVSAVSDPFRAAILLFTGALGGMVAVMARAGGTKGLVESVRHWIRA